MSDGCATTCCQSSSTPHRVDNEEVHITRVQREFMEMHRITLQQRKQGPVIACHTTGRQRRKLDKQDLANSLSPVRDISPTLMQIRGINELPPQRPPPKVQERAKTPKLDSVRAPESLSSLVKQPMPKQVKPIPEPPLPWWNPQTSNFRRLVNGNLTSAKCVWYFVKKAGPDQRFQLETSEFDWNIQPESDEHNQDSMFGYMPICEYEGLADIYEAPPDELPSGRRSRLTDEAESTQRSKSNVSAKESVASEDLFAEGHDDILYEGEIHKFKPGLSANFVTRYVQISLRAFRYFRNRFEAKSGRPIVAFRKRIIKAAVPYKINKASYLKPGSRIAQSGKEDNLFDHMFELELNEDYEDNFNFRDQERAKQQARDREDFRRQMLTFSKRSASANQLPAFTRNNKQALTQQKSSTLLRKTGSPDLNDCKGGYKPSRSISKAFTIERDINIIPEFAQHGGDSALIPSSCNSSSVRKLDHSQSNISLERTQKTKQDSFLDYNGEDKAKQRRQLLRVASALEQLQQSRRKSPFSAEKEPGDYSDEGRGQFTPASHLNMSASPMRQKRNLHKIRTEVLPSREQRGNMSGRLSSLETTPVRVKQQFHKKKTKIISGHAMAIRDLRREGKNGQVSKLNDASITKKEFGKDDNNGKDSMIWKNRQKDWYNAERRFIFASATEKAKDKWIKHIERVKTNKSLLRNKSTLETDRETIVPFQAAAGNSSSAFVDTVRKLNKDTVTTLVTQSTVDRRPAVNTQAGRRAEQQKYKVIQGAQGRKPGRKPVARNSGRQVSNRSVTPRGLQTIDDPTLSDMAPAKVESAEYANLQPMTIAKGRKDSMRTHVTSLTAATAQQTNIVTDGHMSHHFGAPANSMAQSGTGDIALAYYRDNGSNMAPFMMHMPSEGGARQTIAPEVGSRFIQSGHQSISANSLASAASIPLKNARRKRPQRITKQQSQGEIPSREALGDRDSISPIAVTNQTSIVGSTSRQPDAAQRRTLKKRMYLNN